VAIVHRRRRQGVLAPATTSNGRRRGASRGWDKGGFAGLTMRFDCDKPIIAAVNGASPMGGGFEIALACDLIIASENATFALPEPRVGLAALAGGLQRLATPDRPQARHGDESLTARHVSAREGPRTRLRQRGGRARRSLGGRRSAGPIPSAQELADVGSAPQSRAIQRGLSVSLEQAMSEQRRIPGGEGHGPHPQDYIEGPKAFSEKRLPKMARENKRRSQVRFRRQRFQHAPLNFCRTFFKKSRDTLPEVFRGRRRSAATRIPG